ncbi:unnamed protein product [Dracunculus medinensis]|uniref:7TM_GPCR_Srx domain-containing protein n=1 Tax=Dracunculus medinensis TaxID=318479 RepID=A0A0N4UMK3_DRAME|nr:unnamed protein product [Dracunculus medinensis]
MADPVHCLRGAAITIAIWNLIYSLIQLVIFGWQTKFVRDIQWQFENRQMPFLGVNPFQARFPGLYAMYSESPERRRINSYVIFSSQLLMKPNCVWPWFFSAVPIIGFSTTYAILWWTGDVFGPQLTMSVAEFVMSLAINVGIFEILILKITFKIINPGKPSKSLPPWRRQWNDTPPKKLRQKIERRSRSRNRDEFNRQCAPR